MKPNILFSVDAAFVYLHFGHATIRFGGEDVNTPIGIEEFCVGLQGSLDQIIDELRSEYVEEDGSDNVGRRSDV